MCCRRIQHHLSLSQLASQYSLELPSAEAEPALEMWDTPALCYHAVAVGNLEGLQLLRPQSLGLRTHHWDMLCKRSLQYGGLPQQLLPYHCSVPSMKQGNPSVLGSN